MNTIKKNSIKNSNSKVLLTILDGFGLTETDFKNAIKHARKPHLDQILSEYPMTLIEPGGELVGLPKGVAGNSEVGHMNLGAGQSVRQDLVRINEVMAEDRIESLPEFQHLISYAQKGNKRIHLMGLLSDGGVHSHIDHLKYIVDKLKKYDLELYLHAFTDGRDTARDCAARYITEVLSWNKITIASLQGRSIGMDRDRRWNKIKAAVDCMLAMGESATITTLSPLEYVASEYREGRYDEFLHPAMFDKKGAVTEDDAIFFFNFRPDRAIQISTAWTDPKFQEFKMPFKAKYFLCMTPYIQDEVDLPILFDKEKIAGTLSEYLSKLGKKQFKIAETEKYAHVTFFFNGGEKQAFPNETQVLIPSPKDVATYDQKPEMSAYLILDRLTQAVLNNEADFYLVNFANSDMVGHTGQFAAAVKAIEALDDCVGKLRDLCLLKNVTMLITADHGNSEQMIYENGDMHTSHTNSKVPFILVDDQFKNIKLELTEGPHALRDVAPTVLTIMGLPNAPMFTGKNIFV